MSFRFESGETVERGIKRMAREQIDKAVTEIDTQNLTYQFRVHQVRKRCKKLRALARLVRPALGDQYREINRFYRDTAQLLSEVRDAAAVLESYDEVIADDPDEQAADIFAPIRVALEARCDAAAAEHDAGGRLAQVRVRLLEGRAALDDWHVDGSGFAAVAGGLHRVYRRGRKAMKRVLTDPTPANEHDWRKRAKYLRYHARVLRRLWPEMMKPLRNEFKRLSDILGEIHDGYVFRCAAADDRWFAGVESVPAYLDLLARRSEALREEAGILGRRLYAEKPKRFVARLARYGAAERGLA
jgi:CHAD domain-containing protein